MTQVLFMQTILSISVIDEMNIHRLAFKNLCKVSRAKARRGRQQQKQQQQQQRMNQAQIWACEERSRNRDQQMRAMRRQLWQACHKIKRLILGFWAQPKRIGWFAAADADTEVVQLDAQNAAPKSATPAH